MGCDDIVSLIFSQHVQISTHTSRVGCDHLELTFILIFKISTHTSRVGCDLIMKYVGTGTTISTHTSRVGCDIFFILYVMFPLTFLLTHPVWDVTSENGFPSISSIFLLTHPVWDVTAIYSILQPQHPHISRDGLIIHLELY